MHNWIKAYGKVRYGSKQGAEKRADSSWVVVDTHPSIINFYRHQVERNILNPLRLDDGIRLQPPMWGAHITVLDGRKEINEEFRHLWGKHKDERVYFEYSIEVEQHWKFWVLPVRSEQLDEIRKELGMSDNYPFHMTVGRFI